MSQMESTALRKRQTKIFEGRRAKKAFMSLFGKLQNQQNFRRFSMTATGFQLCAYMLNLLEN